MEAGEVVCEVREEDALMISALSLVWVFGVDIGKGGRGIQKVTNGIWNMRSWTFGFGFKTGYNKL